VAQQDRPLTAAGKRRKLAESRVHRFIEVEHWQIALIEDRVEQADAGNFASDEEVERVYAKFNVPRREHVTD